MFQPIGQDELDRHLEIQILSSVLCPEIRLKFKYPPSIPNKAYIIKVDGYPTEPYLDTPKFPNSFISPNSDILGINKQEVDTIINGASQSVRPFWKRLNWTIKWFSVIGYFLIFCVGFVGFIISCSIQSMFWIWFSIFCIVVGVTLIVYINIQKNSFVLGLNNKALRCLQIYCQQVNQALTNNYNVEVRAGPCCAWIEFYKIDQQEQEVNLRVDKQTLNESSDLLRIGDSARP